MGMTYTENIHLGLQEDKRDYLNWDAITTNWKTIDSFLGTGGAHAPTFVRRNLVSPQTAGVIIHVETEE